MKILRKIRKTKLKRPQKRSCWPTPSVKVRWHVLTLLNLKTIVVMIKPYSYLSWDTLTIECQTQSPKEYRRTNRSKLLDSVRKLSNIRTNCSRFSIKQNMSQKSFLVVIYVERYLRSHNNLVGTLLKLTQGRVLSTID